MGTPRAFLAFRHSARRFGVNGQPRRDENTGYDLSSLRYRTFRSGNSRSRMIQKTTVIAKCFRVGAYVEGKKMYIAYYDESGDDGYPRYRSPLFVLTGIYLHYLNWKDAFESIRDIRSSPKLSVKSIRRQAFSQSAAEERAAGGVNASSRLISR